MTEHPEGIIITIGLKMIKEKGYRNWLRNFLYAMSLDDCTYWMKLGSRPKNTDSVQYVYLVIGDKVRFRAYFGGTEGPSYRHFCDDLGLYGRAWVILAGPVERAPHTIEMKGFRGFRYTEKLF
jgi:hypothetical protein